MLMGRTNWDTLELPDRNRGLVGYCPNSGDSQSSERPSDIRGAVDTREGGHLPPSRSWPCGMAGQTCKLQFGRSHLCVQSGPVRPECGEYRRTDGLLSGWKGTGDFVHGAVEVLEDSRRLLIPTGRVSGAVYEGWIGEPDLECPWSCINLTWRCAPQARTTLVVCSCLSRCEESTNGAVHAPLASRYVVEDDPRFVRCRRRIPNQGVGRTRRRDDDLGPPIFGEEADAVPTLRRNQVGLDVRVECCG